MAKNRWKDTRIADFPVIQTLIAKDPQSDRLNDLFGSLATSCLGYLVTLEKLQLKSKVTGKEYFAFRDGERHTRAVNQALFADDELVHRFLRRARDRKVAVDGGDERLDPVDATRACYTLSVGFACAVDLMNPGDQQTPGCLYQYLVTHLLTRELRTNPSKRVRVSVGSDQVALTMDLVLDMGTGKTKYHVAIKNSTRERGSELWAQQHILDEAFDRQYIGLFFGMAETKLGRESLEVVEICVPDQWRAYQYYLAEVKAFYYLDPPNLYLQQQDKAGGFVVKPFGQFFWDVGAWTH